MPRAINPKPVIRKKEVKQRTFEVILREEINVFLTTLIS